MAINKNFVIKNGVEVNTNLLVGDSTLNKVGIATTVPGYTLHIGVGDGARGGIGATDITVTGIATIGVANSTSAALSVTGISTFDGLIDANGGVSARTAAVQDLTAERVVLAGTGGELEDSANLTFDGSTLTVSGDLDPTNVSIASTLEVTGVATFLSGTLVSGIGTFESVIDANDGINASSAKVEDLTDNRVVIAGTGGELEDSGNLTFDGDKLFTGVPINVSTGATITNAGNAAFAGIVTANGGLAVGSAASIHSNGNASFSGIVTVGGNLNVTGDYVVDEITARNLNLTGIATIPTLGVTGLGTFEKLTVGTGVTLQEHGGVSIAGITTIGGTLTLHGAAPNLLFTESDANPDFGVLLSAGQLKFQDTTATANILTLDDDKIQAVKNLDALAGVDVTGALTVSDSSTFNGDVNLGNATGDTITATGRFDSDIVPSTDDARDLGSSSLKFKDLFIDGTGHLDSINAGVATVTSNVNISGVTTTGENLGGFKRLVGSASSTVVSIAVTVATKTTDHRYFDQGSTLGYWLDGVESPFVTLVPGKLYYFDQSHSTNANHPLRFYLEQDKANAYTTEITTGGTAGSSGAYTQIGIGTASNENNHPAVLHYQCSAHALMGNAVATQSNSVNLPDSSAATIRAGLTVSGNLDVDGTANLDVVDIDEGANISGGLVANSAQISDLTDNRVVIAGSSGELEDDANFTFDGSTLNVTGTITAGAGASVHSSTGNAAFAGIVTANGGLIVGAGATISGDILPDGDGSRDLGSSTKEFQDLFIDGTANIDSLSADTAIIGDLTDNRVVIAGSGGELEDSGNLTFDGTKLFAGVPINVSTGATITNAGNAAFAGIVTANGGLLVGTAASIGATGDAVISGIATLSQAYITKLATTNGTSGSANEVPVADGSGGWNWQPVNTTGAGDITGITVKEEGSNVGTANSITILNFVGSDVTADATAQQGICTVTFSNSALNNVVEDTSPDLGGNLGMNSKTINGTGNINITGIVTASQFSLGAGSTLGSTTGITTFIGDGSQLTGVISGIGITEDAGTVGTAITFLNFTGSGISTITADSSVGIATINITGGGGGTGAGVSETSTQVSSTSATGVGSFAVATKRSAAILAQIDQGANYQVGRYLMIHDGTTVTVIEESAVATGSMLGSFSGDINNSNAEFKVTMVSSGIATVITKIDSISI